MTMVTWCDIIDLECSKRNWKNDVKDIVVACLPYNNGIVDL